MKHIAIIGAGISGLICAYELQKAGYTVTVFEKESYPGGRMSTRHHDHFYFDIGADHLGAGAYREMNRYCDELGVTKQPMKEAKFGVYRNGRIHPAYKSVNFLSQLKFARFSKSVGNDLDFFNLSTAIEYDTDSAYNYLANHISQETAEYLANGIVQAYQFHSSKEMSQGALMAYMQSVKHEDWHIEHLVGGMIALPQALAKQLTISFSTPVEKINQTEKTITVDGETIQFDAIVLATTTGIAKQLLIDPTEAQTSLLNEVTFAPTISLSYKLSASNLPNRQIIFTPEIESSTISGYTLQSMKNNDVSYEGKTLINTWLHQEYAQTLMQSSDEHIFDTVKKELEKFTPWRSPDNEFIPYDIQRWNEAMPIFKQGHLKAVKTFLDQHQGEHNLFLCGDYLNSPWTEGAIRCGQRVAESILSKDLDS